MKSNVALHTGQQTYISLYTGGGGLDLGFRLANPDAVPLLYVERELPPAALVVDHIKAGLLDEAPVWADTGTLDCKPFADKVDWIIGGFPCQPWSVAGGQAGLDDERWLWPHIREILRTVQPRGAFFENVPGLLRGGLGPILGDLAALGFDAEWISLRASDVGAPHRRERVFILAYGAGQRLERQRPAEISPGDTAPLTPNSSSETLAYSTSLISERVEREKATDGKPEKTIRDRSRNLGNADESRLEGWQQPVGQRAYERPSWPPGPSDTDAWAEVLTERPDPAPAVGKAAEQGLPKRNRERVSAAGTRDAEFECTSGRNGQASPESEVRGVADGVARRLDRTAQLRILGNGVVPQQAALAFKLLWQRLNHAQD